MAMHTNTEENESKRLMFAMEAAAIDGTKSYLQDNDDCFYI